MEVADHPPTVLPPPAGSTSPSAPRTSPQRAPISPKRSLRDSKFKRVSPKSSTIAPRDSAIAASSSAKTLSRTTRSNTQTSARPLVPVTERRSHDNKNRSKGKKDVEAELNEIVPDGGSGGREGRQFTVSNVGNNGRIYLRPSVRPAHQRYPQPNFTFPVTPPGTASLDALGLERPGVDADSDLHQSQWTPTPRPSPPAEKGLNSSELRSLHEPLTRHRRALSDSTIQDGIGANESDAGAFKIVISKPGEDQRPRPRTTEDLNPNALPHLDINIPSWRIGVPRFTTTGTPLIRGSSYAPSFAQSDEVQSINGSMFNRSQKDLNVMLPPLGPRRPSALQVPLARLSRSTQRRSPGLPSPRSPHPLRSTFMSTPTAIDAPMYDELTFKPACDDRSIVRYAPATGAVTAATPPRLVAEITSPSFLDYELISDFFLTFRAFLEPENLLRMLIARLRWAVARNDEIGMIVHVRAFVALRHWILNYFMDDFLVDYNLRQEFCNLLNGFVDELSQDASAHKVQLKILNELKKCWRRVCGHYWDGPEFEDTFDHDSLIVPGGIAGHRDPNLSPSFWDKEESAPPQLNSLFPVPETSATSFRADVSHAGHLDDSSVPKRPQTPENQRNNMAEKDFGPLSPESLASMDIISCSFPGKHMRNLQPNMGHPLAAHPVSSSSVYNQTGPVATTPRALVGKRVRPQHQQQHQRSSSLPESPEEKEPEKVLFKDHEFLMSSRYAGSLVRGDILPPGKPFVEIWPSDRIRHTTIFESEADNPDKNEAPAGAMSGRGMRKLIGSVRRALSTRGPGFMHSSPGLLMSSAVFGNGSATTTTRLPGTAVVPQQPSSRDGARPPVRIDLLGAEVSEDFKRAVREDSAAEAEKFGGIRQPPQPLDAHDENVEYSAAHLDEATFASLPQNQRLRPTSETGLTGGSKSIVIVDDTDPAEASELQTRLPTANPSVEAFADTLMPHGANMTPPKTPPTTHEEMARRSSHLLNENILRAMSPDPLPPFVPDLATLGGRSTAPPSEKGLRGSRPTTQRSNRPPPVSQGLAKMHRRNKSSRTDQSVRSTLHRRAGSFSSELAPPSTVQSLDATTFSRVSAFEDEAKAPTPKPLRVLRRRPGGDLRAATNVDELDQHVLRRSHSLGSLATFTESHRSSWAYSQRRTSVDFMDAGTSSGHDLRRQGTFSVGQLTEKPTKRELSLCSTGSSKPVMRPSFEAEAKKLAQIPDDENDNGVESALMKLEGTFEAPPRLSMDLQNGDVQYLRDDCDSEMTSVATSVADGDLEPLSRQKTERDHRHFRIEDDGCSVGSTNRDEAVETSAITSFLEVPNASALGHQSFLSDASRESYCSIPLLDRDLTDDGQSKRDTKNWTDQSILQDEEDGQTPGQVPDQDNDGHLSFDFIQKTESVDKIQPGDTAPSAVEEQSFLDSDLSSELSADVTQTNVPDQVHASALKQALPAHPLGDAGPVPPSGLPSPPNTNDPDLDAPENGARAGRHSNQEDLTLKPLPPTPEATPGATFGPRSPFDLIGTARPPFEPEGRETDASRKYSVHLPFVLAFDSEALAQQFTLIEKDALNELDWKELVDMDWKTSKGHNSRSWVDFLRNTEAQGVEVVIARFNLVVKWVVSEIVLTQHIEERARTIIKFIHIAAHCRQYRNFATLAQLTVALSSNEVSRLARTWELVPPKDMKTLRELETLVTPMRNFYNLRAEMESGPDAGCIPFVGIYTHDLLYNAQRPSEIASSPTSAPLVNFERCRMAAGVVKTLLRLLEASSRYNFQPVEGITERCLWIGALSDEEIRRHSGNLE